MLKLIAITLRSAQLAKSSAVFCTRNTALDQTKALIETFKDGEVIGSWTQGMTTIKDTYIMHVTWFVVKFYKGLNFGARNYDRLKPMMALGLVLNHAPE